MVKLTMERHENHTVLRATDGRGRVLWEQVKLGLPGKVTREWNIPEPQPLVIPQEEPEKEPVPVEEPDLVPA